jgi:hypothetical protein
MKARRFRLVAGLFVAGGMATATSTFFGQLCENVTETLP